jgi:hypothetical protein
MRPAGIKRSTTAEAEVVFGSHVRGDNDANSDKDILVVEDNLSLLRARSVTLQNSGWSVAPYTFRKLTALADKGALFVQHLKAESRILHDKKGRFGAILESYRPKKSYASEIRANTNLACLVSSRPATSFGTLWAVDVLYVTVRNFGVLWLAGEGRYVFSYSSIIEALIDSGLVDGIGKAPLLQLRFLKSLYRSGEKLDAKRVSGVLEHALAALPSRFFPKVSAAIDPIGIVAGCSSLPRGVSSYHRLRNLEKAFVAACALDPGLRHDSEFSGLERWIQNPRVYANLAGFLGEGILKSIAERLGIHVRSANGVSAGRSSAGKVA